MRFTSDSFNSGRTFEADGYNSAAARVASCLARRAGGRRACAWTLRHDSTDAAGRARFYQSTSAIAADEPAAARVVGQHWFSVRAVGGAR